MNPFTRLFSDLRKMGREVEDEGDDDDDLSLGDIPEPARRALQRLAGGLNPPRLFPPSSPDVPRPVPKGGVNSGQSMKKVKPASGSHGCTSPLKKPS